MIFSHNADLLFFGVIRHVLEKCVYLLKIAFLAARGGRGGGSLSLQPAAQRAAESQVSSRVAEAFAPKVPQDREAGASRLAQLREFG